jgi:hypothetical protein
MSRFFNYYPPTFYNFDKNSKVYDIVTNLTTKISFEQEFKENSVVYYEYSITDGETPEILAHKIYGSAERHWIILALNDIVNPLIDWPIEQRALNNLIDKKYQSTEYANNTTSGAGITWARNNTYAYYKVETQKNKNLDINFKNKIKVDANTYANISTSSSDYTLESNNVVTLTITKESQNYYDYEIEQNDNKRIIKILKPEFVQEVEMEFKNKVK